MMTGEQYRASLDDGRVVFYDGDRVDVTTHPMFDRSLNRVAATYDRYYDPTPGAIPAYLTPPSTVEEIRANAELDIDPISKNAYGAMMTLLTAADRLGDTRPEACELMREYVHEAQQRNILIGECITDAKGDRAKRPGNQDDPDAYLRVVDRQSDGVVIRGAKLHISGGAIVHDHMVIPTKRMKPGEEDYAIACVVPANAEGVKAVSVTTQPRDDDDLRDAPMTGNSFSPMGFIIFDDVFVPNERVFLDGEVDASATFAHSLGLWVRMTGLANGADEADLFVGFAQLLAEANGLERNTAIKSKIEELVIHATTIRATYEASLANSRTSEEGIVIPNELYANVGKYHGAAFRTAMINIIQDIAGGSLITAPTTRDLANDEVGDHIRKYMATGRGIDGEYRTRLFLAARDLTSGVYAGSKAVSILQAGGGLYAQRVVTRGRYDMNGAKAKALAAAGLEAPAGE